MSWKEQYDNDSDKEAARWRVATDERLQQAIRKGVTGENYAIWSEAGRRPATPQLCWLLYDVLLSDRPYLVRYHCASALLTHLECKEFEAVHLSAGWPTVPDNLEKMREVIEARFGPR